MAPKLISHRKQQPASAASTNKANEQSAGHKRVEIEADSDGEQDSNDDEEETNDRGFKRVRLSMPDFMSSALPDDGDDTQQPKYNALLDEDYDDEDEDEDDEEMPKFQYKSKYNDDNADPDNTEKLNDALFQQFVDFKNSLNGNGSGGESKADQMEARRKSLLMSKYFGDLQQTADSSSMPLLEFMEEGEAEGDGNSDKKTMGEVPDSIPVVTPSDLAENSETSGSTKSAEQEEKKEGEQNNRRASVAGRWPLGAQDKSTLFSTLGQHQHQQRREPAKSGAAVASAGADFLERSSQPDSTQTQEPASLDDFFIMSEADGDGESTGTGTGVSSATDDTDDPAEYVHPGKPNVPLCGFRDRAYLDPSPPQSRSSGSTPRRVLAAMPHDDDGVGEGEEDAAKAKAREYYRQAMFAAAAGLNRRSLKSGRARQMVGGGGPSSSGSAGGGNGSGM